MQEIHEYSYNSHLLNNFSEKVESRIKELHHNRQTIIGINTIEEFVLSKIKLTQFYFDIEDDLREMLQKYKSLFINCKELQEKNHLLASTIRNFEIKNSNLHKIQNDFKKNINDLVSQIGFLKEKQINTEDYISYLEDKVRLTERNLGKKNNDLINDYAHSRNKSRENTNRIINQRNLYDLNNNYLSDNYDLNKLNKISSLDVENNDITYKQRKISKENADKELYYKDDFVERFLNIYKNKKQNSDPQFSVDSNNNENQTNNIRLNYDNLYNKTADEDKDAKMIYNNNNKNLLDFKSIQDSELSKKPISKTIDYEENDKSHRKYNNLFSEREKSKQLLNEYLKNTLNVSSIEEKKTDVNVIEDINNVIVNRNNNNNNEINNNTDQNYNNNNYRKINTINKSKNRSFQLLENDIREYAMDMPVRKNDNNNHINNKNDYLNNNDNDNANNNIDDLIIESQNLNKQKIINNSKNKSDTIVELLMKIKSCSDTSSILMKIHGENLIDKIISPDIDENFLAELGKTISAIDSFKQKNQIPITNMNNNSNNFNHNHNNNANSINNNNRTNIREHAYRFENELNSIELTDQNAESIPTMRKINSTIAKNQTHKRRYSNISGSRSDVENLILADRNYSTKNNNTQTSKDFLMRRSNSKSTLNVSRNSKSKSKGKVDFFDDSLVSNSEAKFEQMLRKYGGRQMSSKVFINYFRKVGDFFDPTLQKGGNSALDLKEQGRKRSGSRRKSGSNNNNNSFAISHS